MQSLIHVDTEWLVDSGKSIDDAIEFLFESMLSRKPSTEELGRLRDYLDSTTDGRARQLEHLHETLWRLESTPRLGAYQIKGNRLTLAIGAAGKARPKRFDTSKQGGDIVITLERVDKRPTVKNVTAETAILKNTLK